MITETLSYIFANWRLILSCALEHLYLVGTATLIAVATAVPLGIAITASKRAASAILNTASMIITVPSIAMFGVLIPILSPIRHGIGYVPALIALVLYAQLPIIRNTYTAIVNVDPSLREAARGMGMTTVQRLFEIEIPIAVPVILTGVRAAVIMNIATATIATYIGAGGLGTFIARGISQTDIRQLLTGALAIGIMAVVADGLLNILQRILTSPGLRT